MSTITTEDIVDCHIDTGCGSHGMFESEEMKLLEILCWTSNNTIIKPS